MNRNTNAHFNELPAVDIRRSTFDRSFSHKLSGNVGNVIPIFYDEILPGDTVSMDTSKIVRFQTLLTPMMDNLYCDVYWFFVANRLVWDHWQNFMGQNDSGPWAPEVEYSVPVLRVPAPAGDGDTPNNNKLGTILDYLGYPVAMSEQTDPVDINALPIRGYCKIVEDWFRKEAVSDPINIYTGDNTVIATTEESYINDLPKGGVPFKAAKFADYFTSCLPSPQRGDPISLASDLSFVGDVSLPVNTSEDTFIGSRIPLLLVDTADTSETGYFSFTKTGSKQTSSSFSDGYYNGAIGLDSSLRDATRTNFLKLKPANLFASGELELESSLSFSVNDLRFAFQLQKLLERDARGGGGYIEIIKSHFGVDSPDQRLQRAEYLGGNRFPITVNQVSNQAQSEQDFLGDLGAYSVTADVHSDFTKSFTEHGMLFGLMVVRQDHTYSQGLEKHWLRSSRYDYYWPVFSNIGEQPVQKKELFLTGTGTFGYQEAWADYRYKPNRVSGLMRPYISDGLWSWTLADDFESAPSLSDGWIREGVENVDRVLAVTSQASDQFWADFYFNFKHTRPMPVYSIPGLIDHN